MTDKELIQRSVFEALGHVKFDCRSPKRLDEAAGVIADFVIEGLKRSARCIALEPISSRTGDTP